MTLSEFFRSDNERRDLTKEHTRFLDAWDKLTPIDKARVEAYMQGILASKE